MPQNSKKKPGKQEISTRQSLQQKKAAMDLGGHVIGSDLLAIDNSVLAVEVSIFLKKLAAAKASELINEIENIEQITDLVLAQNFSDLSLLEASIIINNKFLSAVSEHCYKNLDYFKKIEDKNKIIDFLVEFSAKFFAANKIYVDPNVMVFYFKYYSLYLYNQHAKANLEVILSYYPLVEKIWQLIIENDGIKKNVAVFSEFELAYCQAIREIMFAHIDIAYSRKQLFQRTDDLHLVNKAQVKQFISYAEKADNLISFLKKQAVDIKRGEDYSPRLMQFYPYLSLAYLIVGDFFKALIFREKCTLFNFKEGGRQIRVVDLENGEDILKQNFDVLLSASVVKNLFRKESIDVDQIENFCKLIRLRRGLPITRALLRKQFLELINNINVEPKNLVMLRKLYCLAMEMQQKWSEGLDLNVEEEKELNKAFGLQLEQSLSQLYSVELIPQVSNTEDLLPTQLSNKSLKEQELNQDKTKARNTASKIYDKEKIEKEWLSLVPGSFIIPLLNYKLYCLEGNFYFLMLLKKLAEEFLEKGSVTFDGEKLLIRGFNPAQFLIIIEDFKKNKKMTFSKKSTFVPPFYSETKTSAKSSSSGKERRDAKFAKIIEESLRREKESQVAYEARLLRYGKSTAKKINSEDDLLKPSMEMKASTDMVSENEEDLTDRVSVAEEFEDIKKNDVQIIVNDPNSTAKILAKFSATTQRPGKAIDELSKIYIEKARYFLAAAANIVNKSDLNFSESDPAAVKLRNSLRWFLRRFFVMLHLLEVHKIYNLDLPIAMTIGDCRNIIVHNRTKLDTLLGLVELLRQTFEKESDYWETPHQAKTQIFVFLNTNSNQPIHSPDQIRLFFIEELQWLPHISEIFNLSDDKIFINSVNLIENTLFDFEKLDVNNFQAMISLVATLDSFVDIGEKWARLQQHFASQRGSDGTYPLPEIAIKQAKLFLFERFNDDYLVDFLFFCKNLIRNPACHSSGAIVSSKVEQYSLLQPKDIYDVFDLGIYLAEELKTMELHLAEKHYDAPLDTSLSDDNSAVIKFS